MKQTIFVAIASLWMSSTLMAEEVNSWSAKSTETQFGQTSSPISKKATVKLNLQTMSKKAELSTAVTNRQTAKAKTLQVRPQVNTLTQSFWIYDAWVTFNRDQDRDGFYNKFTIEFDADTEFNHAKVYARLYLTQGEVFKEYHSTSNFNIYADNNDDSFVVESELLTGFPAGDYEVLIELYDAYNDKLVTTLDGFNDADLYLLPLESADYEEVYGDQVVVVHESGGSASLMGLLLLSLIVVIRRLSK